jgi:hypothetical protein
MTDPTPQQIKEEMIQSATSNEVVQMVMNALAERDEEIRRLREIEQDATTRLRIRAERIAELEAREVKAAAKMTKIIYAARHDPDCGHPCDCGLQEALDA